MMVAVGHVIHLGHIHIRHIRMMVVVGHVIQMGHIHSNHTNEWRSVM